MSRSKKTQNIPSLKAGSENDLKDEVLNLIKTVTDLYVKLVDIYESIAGETDGFYEEMSFDDSDLPVTDEEVEAILSEMKKRS